MDYSYNFFNLITVICLLVVRYSPTLSITDYQITTDEDNARKSYITDYSVEIYRRHVGLYRDVWRLSKTRCVRS